MVISHSSTDEELIDILSTVSAVSDEKIKSLNEGEFRADIISRIKRAQWTIEGVIYHFRNMSKHYSELYNDVVQRAFSMKEQSGKYPDVIIFYERLVPNLYHELYAFVNLLRILFDMYPKLIHYQFQNRRNLPKSISSFKRRTTDCGLLERLATDEYINYFKDFRDCINHYRSFAVGTIAIAFSECLSDAEREPCSKLEDVWCLMLLAEFRIENDKDLVFNVYLPDKIFESEGNDKLVKVFSYAEKKNILAYSMRAIRQVAFSYLEAISLIGSEKMFIYKKDLLDVAVEYVDIVN